MDLKNRLIRPDDNSTTRFEPFYQITPKELDEICKEYHAKQLILLAAEGRSEQLADQKRYCNDCGDYIGDGCDNNDCKDFKGN